MIPTPSGRSRSGLRRYRLATVLEEIMGTPDKAIPNSVLAKAEGIAVFPPTVKGGFIFGAHRGQTRGQILVTSVLEGDGALWRLCPGDPRLRRPPVKRPPEIRPKLPKNVGLIGYHKTVIFCCPRTVHTH